MVFKRSQRRGSMLPCPNRVAFVVTENLNP
jgi:hypothetical protein